MLDADKVGDKEWMSVCARMCLENVVRTTAFGITHVGEDRDCSALLQALVEILKENKIPKEAWQNVRTVAWVVDGVAVLLQNTGKELMDLISGLYVLYRCAHHLQRVDAAITKIPKDEELSGATKRVCRCA